MSQDRWGEVDRYLAGLLVPDDPVLDAATAACEAAGLPSISVTPTQGKFLHLLARIRSARTILEVGTLGGYSTIWLARALPPGGKLVTLESDPKHAEVALANLERAGLAAVVEVRVGKALETLPAIAAEGKGPFDLVFIDADKANIPAYFRWAMRLARPGTVVVVDNVVRNGAVADASSQDASVKGVRAFFDLVAAEPGVTPTAVQTVGEKGYDGFAIVVVDVPAPEAGETHSR